MVEQGKISANILQKYHLHNILIISIIYLNNKNIENY